MNRYACFEAIDCMEAYYKMGIHSPKTFVIEIEVKSILRTQLQ